MTSSFSTDKPTTADGEEVYSSDALPFVPIPPPPIPTRNQTTNSSDEDVLDTEGLAPILAFETFCGKQFDPRGTATRRGPNPMETRGERLARIAIELSEMEEKKCTTDNEAAERELVSHLQKRLVLLQEENLKSRHAKLTQNLNKPVAVVGEQVTSNTKDDAYQSSLEERLVRLEGSIGSASYGGKPFMDRILEAEEKLNSVNEDSLNKAAAIAKVIRADLEGAAKAKTKLNSTSSTPEVEKISKLYTQMTDLSGFLSPSSNSTSSVLNAIVDRLASCSELHQQALNFNNDLKNVEDMVKNVETLVSTLEETVGNVEKGLESNLKVMQENLEEFDKRL